MHQAAAAAVVAAECQAPQLRVGWSFCMWFAAKQQGWLVKVHGHQKWMRRLQPQQQLLQQTCWAVS
jgi:hypothetical protein